MFIHYRTLLLGGEGNISCISLRCCHVVMYFIEMLLCSGQEVMNYSRTELLHLLILNDFSNKTFYMMHAPLLHLKADQCSIIIGRWSEHPSDKLDGEILISSHALTKQTA